MQEETYQLPQIDSRLRKNILRMPEAVFQASGIVINGRRIKSFVFTNVNIISKCSSMIRDTHTLRTHLLDILISNVLNRTINLSLIFSTCLITKVK